MFRIFDDRQAAGRALVGELRRLELHDPLVLALPRGGVPVGLEVAKALAATLDIMVVRKLGAPWQPELAIGAIASGGVRVLNDALVAMMPALDEAEIARLADAEQAELERREKAYRGDRPYPELAGRDVVLVDDGMATGATMRAAVEAARSRGPSRIVVAVPVGARDAVAELSRLADEVVCLESPADFLAVGQFYRVFGQTSDAEVRACLDEAAVGRRRGGGN